MRKLIIILIISIAFYSCSRQLDLNPQSFIDGGRYFRTAASIEYGLNGAYSDLQILYNTAGANDFWALTEMRSDNTSFQYNPADRGEFDMEFVETFMETPSDNDIELVWERLYMGVAHCNTILSRIEDVPFEDAALKHQFTGEAKFLRSFYYFNLVRLFGDVPLILEEVQSPDEAFSGGRAPVKEVYDQIIHDTREAASMLPSAYTGTDVGRATSGAAYTLLGEIYMTLKDFPAAVRVLDSVTGYSLMPDYEDIFAPAHKNNPESIFEVQFNASLDGEASQFAYRFVPFNSGSDIIGFNNLTRGHAGYNIPTTDIIGAYQTGDKRKEASIAFYVKPDNTQYDVALGDSIPYIKKYVHPFEQPGKTNENWPVYRYGRVLLLMAEALNEVGQTGTAYGYINKVRNRAGIAPLTPGLGREAFRDSVYHEEQVECAFENHRWFDLLRTGRALQTMTEHGKVQKQLKPRLTADDFDVKEFKLLYPIPQRAVRVDHLTQNPGR
ncbi:RagB/SusD family nutrient uptake outer membrane protein [Compostibacter hankyongensis]|uniref:RagB/SusD family nutrient uptake outer membrane protein n=1 Tax=Compostibacter hankyongensis TaxID=1007089 RepID=A0ABP8FBR3_9BACT